MYTDIYCITYFLWFRVNILNENPENVWANAHNQDVDGEDSLSPGKVPYWFSKLTYKNDNVLAIR